MIASLSLGYKEVRVADLLLYKYASSGGGVNSWLHDEFFFFHAAVLVCYGCTGPCECFTVATGSGGPPEQAGREVRTLITATCM